MNTNPDKNNFITIPIEHNIPLNMHSPEELTPLIPVHEYISPRKGSEKPLENRLSDIKHIFKNPELKRQFFLFLDDVFLQLDPSKFELLVNEILNKNLSYEATYKELSKRIGKAKKEGFFSSFGHLLHSLHAIKKAFAQQIKELLCEGTIINGYLDYGFQGLLIKPLKKDAAFNFTGTQWISTNTQSITDRIQNGFPFTLSYDKFCASHDYAPLPNTIKDQSLDLVTCLHGLHRTPFPKMDSFLRSIYKKLTVGGSLIIKHYDARASDLARLANVVESVYNAAIGESWNIESKEVRNFQDITTWDKLLKNHGFQRDEKSPTKNGLVRYVKIAKKTDEQQSALERFLRMSLTSFQKPQSNTFLTTIERHLVAISKEYADSIKMHSMHSFPFFKHVNLLWKLFFSSMKEAIAADGLMNVAKSQYTAMNLLMLACTTTEFVFKGLVYSPLALRFWKMKDIDSGVVQVLHKASEDYASFIYDNPFYHFNYFERIRDIWKALKEEKFRHFFLALPVTLVTTVDYLAKGVISAFLSKMLPENQTDGIHVIVNNKLSLAESNFSDDEEDSMDVEEKTEIKNDSSKFMNERPKKFRVVKISDNTELMSLDISRCFNFKNSLRELVLRGFKIFSIAGQKNIQVKVKVPSDFRLNFDEFEGIKLLGEIDILSDPLHKYLRLNVESESLTDVLPYFEESQVIDIHA